MLLGEMKRWVFASVVSNPKEWSLGIGVPASTFAFSLVPTLDLTIKFLQVASLIGGLIFGYYQIRKARADWLQREKENRDDSESSNPDGL